MDNMDNMDNIGFKDVSSVEKTPNSLIGVFSPVGTPENVIRVESAKKNIILVNYIANNIHQGLTNHTELIIYTLDKLIEFLLQNNKNNDLEAKKTVIKNGIKVLFSEAKDAVDDEEEEEEGEGESSGGKLKKNQKKKTFKNPIVSQNKESQYKEVLGKRMKIYKKPDSRKEYVKYKGELHLISDYKNLIKHKK